MSETSVECFVSLNHHEYICLSAHDMQAYSCRGAQNIVIIRLLAEFCNTIHSYNVEGMVFARHTSEQ